ncbi:hypothetical protein CA850_29875 [Micromonospora echinospora]|uniref:Flavin reductase n=1 Tax=Micromonospora echinospora TaxID=1877 RepID=A0A1C5AAF8_MICEC|nr:flavin reductase [Micromonospora echinospora]OZV74788.1 hypothetical protein CA850_29875 [Micromonospora echinospora]SCF42197.1 hypothetical protein GA0070618_6626 [Micromonospora echinospora]
MPRPHPGSTHVYSRPAWRCRTCGAPWPCQPAKLRLLGEYKKDRLALSMYLGTLLDVAVSEVPADSGENLLERFVSWARPPRRPRY